MVLNPAINYNRVFLKTEYDRTPLKLLIVSIEGKRYIVELQKLVVI